MQTRQESEARFRRVRQEPKRRELRVVRVEALSPYVANVVLGGDDLSDFASHAFDDHVKVFLPSPAAGAVAARDYTPRRFDAQARELSIEFALHGEGPAALWAQSARPGDPLTVVGPRGSFIVPDDLDWYLLVGDSSSLPAIARRLEELPTAARVLAIVDMAEGDRRAVANAGPDRLRWVSDTAGCLAAVRAWSVPAGEGLAWCAGEAVAMRELRRVLVEEKAVDPRSVRAAAYWKRGAAGHHERLGEPA